MMQVDFFLGSFVPWLKAANFAWNISYVNL